jgi:RNA polymerase sigma factor (sigma-70 family)
MATGQLGTVLRHIRGLAADASINERTDGALLRTFLSDNDPSAFEALLLRHGPMVLRVCRRALGNAHDAEDALQATFLVLAQKARSIRKRESLASWLHGVAYRMATDARRAAARRHKHESRANPTPPRDPALSAAWQELQVLLDEEIARLPETLRQPFVLCCLENHSSAEAARQLGLQEAAVWKRLSRARQRLQGRLSRRGVALATVLAAVAVTAGGAAAALPRDLVGPTVKAAAQASAGRALVGGTVSGKVLALVKGVNRAMFLNKCKTAILLLVCTAIVGAGLGMAVVRCAAGAEPAAPPAPPEAAREGPKKDQQPAADVPAKDKDAVKLSGHVLDPDGKPVAGAKVHLLQWGPAYGGPPPDRAPKVWAETDKDGRFSFTAPRYYGELFVTAAGFAPGWEMTSRLAGAVMVGAPQETRPAEDGLVVRLAKDDVTVSGRLLDLQGEPVAGATVRVFALKASPDGKLDKWVAAVKKRTLGQNLRDDEYLSSYHIDGLAHFFPPVTTDRDGRFRIKGVGRERIVEFTVEGPTVETRVLHVVTRPGLGEADLRIPENTIFFAGGEIKELRMKPYYPPSFTHTADPCRVVTGVVRDKATGKPIAGAVVRGDQPVRYPAYYNRTTTDKEGRYRLTGLALTPEGRLVAPGPSVVVLPPEGEPYLALRKAMPADREAKETKFDFDLPRGVWLEGQVKDKATGRGVPAQLQYFAFTEWKLEGRMILPGGEGVQQFRDPFRQLTTDEQGKFRILAAAERGMLGATATREESNHYLTGVGADKINAEGAKGQPGGGAVFAIPPGGPSVDAFDTLVEVKPEKGAASVRCDVELDPGRTLTVQVRGPDGKPLDGVRAHGQSARLSYNGWSRDPLASEFTLYGLEPGKTRTLLLDHPKKNLAARREVKGDERGPVVVTLEPAASAVGRLVDDDGRPVADADILVQFRPSKDTPPYQGYYHSRSFRTDAQGKFRIDGLIAGESYSGLVRRQAYVQPIFDDLSLKGGDSQDLGDLKVKKPGQ